MLCRRCHTLNDFDAFQKKKKTLQDTIDHWAIVVRERERERERERVPHCYYCWWWWWQFVIDFAVWGAIQEDSSLLLDRAHSSSLESGRDLMEKSSSSSWSVMRLKIWKMCATEEEVAAANVEQERVNHPESKKSALVNNECHCCCCWVLCVQVWGQGNY